MTMLIGHKAPDFTTQALLPGGEISESFNLHEHIKGHYGIVFFYPHDFTFVCPSEIIAFNNRKAAFEERNAKILSISIDSVFTHHAWQEKPVSQGGVGPLDFPMVADLTHQISHDYGVASDGGPAYRGTFIIDRKGIIRHVLINDMPLGRNIDETLRTLDALQFFEENGDVCPANWQKGEDGMAADSVGVAHWLDKNAKSV